MAIDITIPTIRDYPKLGDTHNVFRQKADIAWTDLANLIPEVNKWSTQANNVRNDAYGFMTTAGAYAGAANSARDEAITAKNEAISAKDLALSTKEYMESYVVPTEATYSEQAIDAKIEMTEILNLVGA